MVWDGFLSNVATALNITQGMAGIVCSLVATIIVDIITGIASRSGLAVIGSTIVGIIFFVAIEWFPQWTGAILGLVFGLIFAQGVAKTIYQ